MSRRRQWSIALGPVWVLLAIVCLAILCLATTGCFSLGVGFNQKAGSLGVWFEYHPEWIAPTPAKPPVPAPPLPDGKNPVVTGGDLFPKPITPQP